MTSVIKRGTDAKDINTQRKSHVKNTVRRWPTARQGGRPQKKSNLPTPSILNLQPPEL